jgi:sulfur carrier protein
VNVIVNGEPREVPGNTTLADLLTSLNVPPTGVAAALDGDLVTRSDWPGTRLYDNARIDVLTAVQGG